MQGKQTQGKAANHCAAPRNPETATMKTMLRNLFYTAAILTALTLIARAAGT